MFEKISLQVVLKECVRLMRTLRVGSKASRTVTPAALFAEPQVGYKGISLSHSRNNRTRMSTACPFFQLTRYVWFSSFCCVTCYKMDRIEYVPNKKCSTCTYLTYVFQNAHATIDFSQQIQQCRRPFHDIITDLCAAVAYGAQNVIHTAQSSEFFFEPFAGSFRRQTQQRFHS